MTNFKRISYVFVLFVALICTANASVSVKDAEKVVSKFYADTIAAKQQCVSLNFIKAHKNCLESQFYDLLIKVQSREFPNCLEFIPWGGGQMGYDSCTIEKSLIQNGVAIVHVRLRGDREVNEVVKVYLLKSNDSWKIANFVHICEPCTEPDSIDIKAHLVEKLAM